MAITYFPLDSGAGAAVTQAAWQKMARNWFTSGVVRNGLGTDLQAVAPGGVMSVNVGAGRAALEGFFFESSAAVAVAIATADPTNPRLDTIVVQLDLSGHTMSLVAVTGVASSSPLAPTLTNNGTVYQMAIAGVNVAANVATIAPGNVTDSRSYGAATLPPSVPTWAVTSLLTVWALQMTGTVTMNPGYFIQSSTAPSDIVGFGLNGYTDVGIMAATHTAVLGGGLGSIMKTNNYIDSGGTDRFISATQQASQLTLTGNAIGIKISTNTPTANAAITWGTTRYL